jgi:hypothetical protein
VDSFIMTCEHGRNRIPAPYRRLFREQRARLRFAPCDYVGIELEVHQGMVFAAGQRRPALDGVAAHSDRFVTHGMWGVSASRFMSCVTPHQ